MTKPRPHPLADWIERVESHHRLFVSVVVAAIAFGLAIKPQRTGLTVIFAWDVFSVTLLGLAWLQMLVTEPSARTNRVTLPDTSRSLIFFSVITGACASLFAVGYVLGSVKGSPTRILTEHVSLAVVTVILSWGLIHTAFALRYAHVFYRGMGDDSLKPRKGGLEFPSESQPDYLDFAYFSFVIGMTCQVSDVQITSRRLRRLALLHGLLSFLFNTVIIALGINVVSGIL